jgi:hypothetical protein
MPHIIRDVAGAAPGLLLDADAFFEYRVAVCSQMGECFIPDNAAEGFEKPLLSRVIRSETGEEP